MNLLSLEYFLVTAEEMNFTKAAKRLYITQQSLSSHIKRLEEYFGCALFDRNPPLSLTNEGIGLQSTGRKLLTMVSDLEKEIQDIKDLRDGEITIGITRTRGNIYLPPIIRKYHELFPYIRIKIFEGDSQETEKALENASIDLLIGYAPINSPNVKSVPFWKEQTVIVVPEIILKKYFPADARAIISGKKHVSLADFRFCPMIAMSKRTRLGTQFHMFCSNAGFIPNVIVEADSLSTLVPLCLAGMGIIVCPEVFLLPYKAKINNSSNEKVFVFSDSGVASTTDMCVNYLKEKYMSVAVKGLLTIIEEEKDCFSWFDS